MMRNKFALAPFLLLCILLLSGCDLVNDDNDNESSDRRVQNTDNINCGENLDLETCEDSLDPETPETPETPIVPPITASFSNPLPGESVVVGTGLEVEVAVFDSDSRVANVKLYLDNRFIRQEDSAPYAWTATDIALQNLKAGTYVLKAEITEKDGVVTQVEQTLELVGQDSVDPPIDPPETEFLHEDIVEILAIADDQILQSPGGEGWADSYSVGDQCYCQTTFDHNIGGIEVATPRGRLTIREVCQLLGPGPGSNGRPLYNDIQCGNGPANDAGDEDWCPGLVAYGKAGCRQIGPKWDFSNILCIECETDTQEVAYVPDNATDFLNPERGWMERGDEGTYVKARAGDNKHSAGYSVVWSDVGDPAWNGSSGNPFRLDNYRAAQLPASLLSELKQMFASARQSGIKLKVRFSYNYSGGGARDTKKEWMLQHIEQLAPVLTDNADTIASLDAGFIGYWGEMHSSTDLADQEKDTVEVVRALLAATPKTMSIGVRYPRIVRGLFGDTGYQMDLAARFSGSDQSRIGWYNDCLWSNQGNTGTYSTGNNFFNGRNAFEYVGQYAATSGESCNVGGINDYNSCESALVDMEKIGGPDTLFRGFWQNIYERWQDEGCYAEVSLRLGYRFQLVSGRYPVQLVPGQAFNVGLTIRNTGFGKLYNPRPLDLVFVDPAGNEFTARLSSDIRLAFPLAGKTVSVNWSVDAPLALESGQNYDLYLRLPDPSERLEGDNRYSIRLANGGGIWNSETGRHDLEFSVEAK